MPKSNKHHKMYMTSLPAKYIPYIVLPSFSRKREHCGQCVKLLLLVFSFSQPSPPKLVLFGKHCQESFSLFLLCVSSGTWRTVWKKSLPNLICCLQFLFSVAPMLYFINFLIFRLCNNRRNKKKNEQLS